MFIQKFYSDFQNFVFTNKLLSASSGYVFGMVSKDYIDSFLRDILFPIIASWVSFDILRDKIQDKYPLFFILLNFLWITVLWISTIFISFFLMEYILYRKVLGLSGTLIKEEDKKNYINMRVKAQTSGIVGDEKEIKEIESENESIKEKVKEGFFDLENFTFT